MSSPEEAIINALISATTLTGRGGHTAWGITDPNLQTLANPNPTLVSVMQKYNRLNVGSGQ